ncbi:ionotropic receptor 21a-like [Oratosquilla oratoria]|uniref:ionotropic receptor 21a-like n=1 Tax=Oratosquilla oratoria TaxID=337810 RepID=UPI003F7691A0
MSETAWILVLLAIVQLSGAQAPLRPSLEQTSLTNLLLQDLVENPLRDEYMLLVHDSASEVSSSFSVVAAAFRSHTSVVMSSMADFRLDDFPTHQVQGPNVTALVVFSSDEVFMFLDYLQLTFTWNPGHLVLVCSNSSVDAPRVLHHAVVLRSLYLVLFQLEQRRGRAIYKASDALPSAGQNGQLTFATSLRGQWKKGRFATKSDLFRYRFGDFRKAVIALASWCDDFPFIYLAGEGCKGSSLQALDYIGEVLNFSYIVQVEPQDLNWGDFENGNWTGMMGDLMFHNKQLAINYFYITPERGRDFDFTFPYEAEGFGFMLRLPPPLPQWKSLLYPFSSVIWGLVVATVVFVGIMFAGLYKLQNHHQKDSTDATALFLIIFSSMVRQSVSNAPTSWAWMRVWLGPWWLASIIVSLAYTCNLIAFLTIPVYPERIETVSDLAKADVRITMQDYGNFVPRALLASNDESLKTLGEKLDLFGYGVGYVPGGRMVLAGTHALIETKSYLFNQQIILNLSKTSYIMKDEVYSGHLSWFLPKNTPYTDRISRSLQSLREGGILLKLYREHMEAALGPAVQDKKVGRGDKSMELTLVLNHQTTGRGLDPARRRACTMCGRRNSMGVKTSRFLCASQASTFNRNFVSFYLHNLPSSNPRCVLIYIGNRRTLSIQFVAVCGKFVPILLVLVEGI